MFSKGLSSNQSLILKSKSNLKSSKTLKTFVNRLKRIPDFIESYRRSKQLPKERGYIYLQEYIENEGFDLKVVVIGNKVSFVSRKVRKGDFRASGGGDISYDKDLINKEIVKMAYDISRKIKSQCVGLDIIIDKNSEPKILEISYGFSHIAQRELGGYWEITEQVRWVNKSFNAPLEVLLNLKSNIEHQ